MDSPNSTSSNLHRRNGTIASCEPCRKRKLACDHTLPVCRRCQRRKITSDCVYVGTPIGARRDDRERPTNLGGVGTSWSKEATDLTVAISTELQEVVPQSLFDYGAGYVGSTSYSAVFLENRLELDPSAKSTPLLKSTTGGLGQLPAISRPKSPAISADQYRTAKKLLARLPDEQTCEALLAPELSKGDGWLRIVADRLCKSLWASFRKALQARAGQTYDDLVDLVFRNSFVPLQDQNGMEAEEWLDSLSGRKLRWEGIGVIFAQLAFRILGLLDSDPLFASISTDRRRLWSGMKDCLRACTVMCGAWQRPSFLVVYLSYKQIILESMISGDTSTLLWTQHGELVALCLAAGLHKVEDSAEQLSMLTEMKKRTFAKVFTYDKILSAFHGRPPLLSWRYSSTSLPLDIDCEFLLAKRSDLVQKRETLDANGWNTDDGIFYATYMRARMLLARNRDRILDLDLSNEAVTHDAICAAKRAQRATDDQFPSVIRCRECDLVDRSTPSAILDSRLGIRLDQLQNIFLLERVAQKNSFADGGELLDAAREMLGLTLVYWKQWDRLIAHRNDLGWFIVTYAAPASGVLCLELIREQQVSPTQTLPRLPRSETIQNLSLFVGVLEWVRPSAPNAALCARLLQTVKYALDRILEPRAQPNPVPAADTETFLPSPMVGTASDVLDDFSWMDWILDNTQLSSSW